MRYSALILFVAVRLFAQLPMGPGPRSVLNSGGGTTTIDVTNPGHGLTSAVCDGVTDDQPAFAAILAYAGMNATDAAPYTVTVPANSTCLMNSWATNAGGDSYNLSMPSNVTLMGLGANRSSTLKQGLPCPPSVSTLHCGGRATGLPYGDGYAILLMIGSGNSNSGRCTSYGAALYNVASAVSGSNVITLSTPSQTSGFIVGSDVWLMNQDECGKSYGGNAQMNRIVGIDLDGPGTLRTEVPISHGLPFMGRQAVVYEETVAGAPFRRNVGIMHLNLAGAPIPIYSDVNSHSHILDNNITIFTFANLHKWDTTNGGPCVPVVTVNCGGGTYVEYYNWESTYHSDTDSNSFNNDLPGPAPNGSGEFLQRNSGANHIHNNYMGTPGAGGSGMRTWGEAELGSFNNYDSNHWYLWGCTGGCFIDLEGYKDQFINNDVHLDAVDTGNTTTSASNYILNDGQQVTDGDGDNTDSVPGFYGFLVNNNTFGTQTTPVNVTGGSNDNEVIRFYAIQTTVSNNTIWATGGAPGIWNYGGCVCSGDQITGNTFNMGSGPGTNLFFPANSGFSVSSNTSNTGFNVFSSGSGNNCFIDSNVGTVNKNAGTNSCQ